VAPADKRTLREHIIRCWQERVRVEHDITFLLRRMPPVSAHVASVPLLAHDGHVTGVKTTLTDVTAFKRAQEKLVFLAQASTTLGSSFDSEATLAQVARQAVPVLGDICIVDLMDAGGVLRRLTVAFADPGRAESLASFIAVAPRADEGTAIGKAIRTRQALLFPECTPTSLVSSADGFDHEILIKVSGAASMMVAPMVARDTVHGVITVIAAESGRHYSGTSLSTLRDLAAHAALAVDNARLYEKAQQAVRAREDILSFVSHDLRNPLMGIQLTTETILRGVRAEERRKGWKQIERIRRGAQQMRHMIDDLLDMASLDSGRLTVQFTVQDVRRLFDDASSMLAPIAAEKGIALSFDAPADGLIIRCDRDRVFQVLSNLIGNSLKFTPQGGSIVIVAQPAGEAQVVIAVSDTGPGISPVIRPHIFERFWQGEDDTRKGRGLGLYIAKGLVEAQGGAIWVDSPPEGGATFSFTLSLASAAEVDSFRATMETTKRGPLGHGPTVGRG
jgi:signal transduction histidine kinase